MKNPRRTPIEFIAHQLRHGPVSKAAIYRRGLKRGYTQAALDEAASASRFMIVYRPASPPMLELWDPAEDAWTYNGPIV